VDASEYPLLLEDEVVSAQGLQGWCLEEKVRGEAEGFAQGSSHRTSTPRPNPSKEWKKSKMKTEDLLALVNSGFLWEKEMDVWCATAGDLYPREKNPDEVRMFASSVERGLALRALDFFKGLLKYHGIEYLNLNPIVFSMSLYSCTSANCSWESSPTGSCSESSPV
jgi:hypothetical protein